MANERYTEHGFKSILARMDNETRMMFIKARDLMRKEEARMERLSRPPEWVECPNCGNTVDKMAAPRRCPVCKMFVSNWNPYKRVIPGKLGVVRRRNGREVVVKAKKRIPTAFTGSVRNLVTKRQYGQTWREKAGPKGEREKIRW